MKTLRDWGLSALSDIQDEDRTINFAGYSILYTATEIVHLLIFDNLVEVRPLTFYHIPEYMAILFRTETLQVIMMWFKVDLFLARLAFLSHIKKWLFFRNPLGWALPNS